MKRIISKLKSKLKNYKNAITFYEFDIENDKILAQEFNVGIAPTIIIYKGAEIRAFFNGIVSFDYIESKIKAVSEN